MRFISITPQGATIFDSLVQKEPALVKFYSEGCGHCKAMKGEWEKLKREIKPYKNVNLNVIEVPADAIPNIKSKCAKNIKGYPTIVEVLPGGEIGMEHSGERTTKDLMKTIRKMIKKHKGKTKHGEAGAPGNDETPTRIEDTEQWNDAFGDDDEGDAWLNDPPEPITLRQMTEQTAEAIQNRPEHDAEEVEADEAEIESLTWEELKKKAEIWAEYPSNREAEAAHSIELLPEDLNNLRMEAQYLRDERRIIDATGIKKRRKSRKKSHKRRTKRKAKNKRRKTRRRYSRMRK